MANVTFRKGLEENLPTDGMAEEGCVYHATDSGNAYIGSSNGSLIPLNRSPYYGTSSTGSSTNSKVVTLDTDVFSLYQGVMITVKFANANTASSPTLNVNSTGAIAVKLYGTTAAGNTPAKSWNAGEAVTFVYDGSYWLLVGGGEDNIGHLNTNNTTAQTPSASESFTGDINLHKVAKTGSYNDLNDTPVYALGESVGGPAKKAISIPFGQVDSTSTSTVFTATVDGISELRDGVCCYIRNGVVASESGWTLNINGLGAKPVWSSLSNAATTTIFTVASTFLFVYNSSRITGGCWDIYYGYDSNTNTDTIGYQLRTNSTTKTTTDQFRYYKILFTSADNTQWVPASATKTNSTTTAIAVNQRPINPFGEIAYFGYTTNYSAGGSVTATRVWQQNVLSLGYSFNPNGGELTLTSGLPVYVKCAPQSNGSAIIDSTTPTVQTLPSTEDGKIYIFLGVAYSATTIELTMKHPVYYYKGGAIRIWANDAIQDDTNFVHKTGNETIAGVKTFTDNVILEDAPTQGSHAANKEYVDNADNSVFLNGATADYKIHPYSLCAFAIWNGGTWMAMTSFTNVGGTGSKTSLSEVKFPIGCKIYYHPDSEEAPAVTSFYHKKFYTSYKSVDARYSAITGSNVSLGTQNWTSVYLMVSVDGYYWSPYYKEGSSEEIIVSPDNFESGNYYIYLGKKSTLTINGYEFQLEDNNILYYFDGDDLIDWASYIANRDASSVLPSGGTTGQVLAKASNDDNDVEWVNQSAGVTDYDELDDLPQINGVTLSGNKTSSQLGLQNELTFDNTPTANSDNPVKSGGVKTALDAKQDTLVSGTNIKTVNNTSLLGSGNIQINDGVGFQTITTQQDGTMQITLTNGDTITVDLNHVHPQYYSKVVESVMPQGGFLPDVVYSLGVLSSNTTFSLAPNVVGNVNHYYWTFSTATTAITVTWPAKIIWVNGNMPTIAANKHYEISILDNFAVYMETSIQDND